MSPLSLEEQFAEIIHFFPQTITLDATTLEVPLFPKASVTLKCKKYPKRSKIILPKDAKKLLGDFESFIPVYRKWRTDNPPSLKDILFYIQAGTETISGYSVHLSDKVFHDICYIAKSAYPNEMFCLLRMVNGILHEYVMAPGMEASESTAVFFPSRLNQDANLLASCHSHPSGNVRPSAADLQTFKKKPVNIIVGSPFDSSHLGVYNHLGKPIPFQINSVDFEHEMNDKLSDFLK